MQENKYRNVSEKGKEKRENIIEIDIDTCYAIKKRN